MEISHSTKRNVPGQPSRPRSRDEPTDFISHPEDHPASFPPWPPRPARVLYQPRRSATQQLQMERARSTRDKEHILKKPHGLPRSWFNQWVHRGPPSIEIFIPAPLCTTAQMRAYLTGRTDRREATKREEKEFCP